MFILPLFICLALCSIAWGQWLESPKPLGVHGVALIDCHAARPGVLNQTQIEFMMRDLQWNRERHYRYDGKNPIGKGHRVFWRKQNQDEKNKEWVGIRRAYRHCTETCFLPALTYGFDAAVCRLGDYNEFLPIRPWLGEYQVMTTTIIVGYTPTIHLCRGYDSPTGWGSPIFDQETDQVCIPPPTVTDLFIPDRLTMDFLQDYANIPPDPQTVWTSTKKMVPKGVHWMHYPIEGVRLNKTEEKDMVNMDYRYIGIRFGEAYHKFYLEKLRRLTDMFPDRPYICALMARNLCEWWASFPGSPLAPGMVGEYPPAPEFVDPPGEPKTGNNG